MNEDEPEKSYFKCVPCGEDDIQLVTGPIEFPAYRCQRCAEGRVISGTGDEPRVCICDEAQNYIQAGDMCLAEDEIKNEIETANTDRVDYENVSVSGGEDAPRTPGQEFGITSSDTFSYLYLKAAYLCWKYRATDSTVA